MSSVYLFVCPVPDISRVRKGIYRKLKIGSKQARVTRDQISGRKVSGQGNKVISQNRFSFEARATAGGAT